MSKRRMAKAKIPPDLERWIEARKRHRLSHAHVLMAWQLGMNPRKLGKLDNHKQEPWKAPLPEFIEHLYFRRFGKTAPDEIISIEELARRTAEKKAKRKAAKAARKQANQPSGEQSATGDLTEACTRFPLATVAAVDSAGGPAVYEIPSTGGATLFMVVERFKEPGAVEVYRRARDQGRLLPEGLRYVASWVDLDFTCCFQLMQTENASLLEAWAKQWQDLVEFEIIPVRTSAGAAAVMAPRL